MVISICIVLTLTLSIVEPDIFAMYTLRYAHFNKYVGYVRNCLYPFQHACASGDSRLRQLVEEDVASSQCKCTAFFTTITSTKFASPHIWFEDYTFRTLSEAVHWTGPRRISFCFFRLHLLLTMGAERFADLHGSFLQEQKQESWLAS